MSDTTGAQGTVTEDLALTDPSVTLSYTLSATTSCAETNALCGESASASIWVESIQVLNSLGEDISNAFVSSDSGTNYNQNATGTMAAPEIDPASAFGGLTLLLGGLAVLRGRRLPPTH